jgi:hypothetical protein
MLIQIYREALFRIEQRLIQAESTACTSRVDLDVKTERLMQGQDTIEQEVRDSSHVIQLDTRWLLDICIGLSVRVDRLDKRQLDLRNQMRRSRSLIRHQPSCAVTTKKMAGSVHSLHI